MNYSYLVTATLWTATLMALLTLVADVEATRQMRTSRYRWVPLIRTLRKMRIPAAALIAGFCALAMAVNPIMVVLLLFACLLTLLSEGNRVLVGSFVKAFFGGLLPWLVMLFAAVNLAEAAQILKEVFSSNLKLPPEAMLPAALVSGFLMASTYFRDEQDILRYQD